MPTSTRAPHPADADTAPDQTDLRGRRRPRLRPKRLGLLLAVPLLALGLTACEPSGAQEEVRRYVNEERGDRGIHGLRDELTVRLKAQDWAEHLAAERRLSHSSLSSGLDGLPWVGVAENVGRASSTRAVHDAFMASSKHRSNILDRRWDVIGTGHAIGSDGQVYIAQVFVDLG